MVQFRQDMALLRSWQDDMGMLTAGQDMGCLHVSLSTLQQQLESTLYKVSCYANTHGLSMSALLASFFRGRCCASTVVHVVEASSCNGHRGYPCYALFRRAH